METIYSKLEVETSYNCAKWCSVATYQKVNSSIISKGAMNSFKEMFPLTVMHRGAGSKSRMHFFPRLGPLKYLS